MEVPPNPPESSPQSPCTALPPSSHVEDLSPSPPPPPPASVPFTTESPPLSTETGTLAPTLSSAAVSLLKPSELSGTSTTTFELPLPPPSSPQLPLQRSSVAVPSGKNSTSSMVWDPLQLQVLHNHLESILTHLPATVPEKLSAPQNRPPQKSYASFFSPVAISPPPALPPPAWKDGKLTMKIPLQMIKTRKDSFFFLAIEKFVGRRSSLETLEQ
ncbi:hypothetical protein MRB53_005899 [Persea americana]|uniref:Uncharacterized protein n=1 Tax=Persea americana TaxID=3435 RepID=A0ACC2MFH3_PERAE|nr:hypothetical protein MRB53_005899 [Persea americana]